MTTPKAETTPKTRKSRNKDSEEQAKEADEHASNSEKYGETLGRSEENVKSVDRRHQNPGRPSICTPELTGEIFSRMSEGESLRSICRDDAMPNIGTVLRWIAHDTILSKQYDAAMEQRAEAMFEEMFEIADETKLDTIETETGERPNAEWISRSRLRVDVRKWALSKMMPKKYGDKVVLAGDPEQPLRTEATLNVSGLSTEALAEIMKASDAAKSS